MSTPAITPYDPNYVVPGTGQTVGDLQNLGYSTSDIQTLLGTGTIDTTVADGGGFSGGGLSGISDIFGSVATGITNVYRTFNPPKPGTPYYNPQTGTYQAVPPVPATAYLGTSSNGLILIVLGILAVVLLVRKA